MGEKVLFEYVAGDSDGNFQAKGSGNFIPKLIPFESHCGAIFHCADGRAFHNPKHFKRARRQVRKTLGMLEDLYDEIFGEQDSKLFE